MKRFIKGLFCAVFMAVTLCAMFACSDKNTIYVDTNAYFAPFEYYDGTKIKGVDVDIMKLVGEKTW